MKAHIIDYVTDPDDIEGVRDLGVIDLPTLQKKVNFHFSVTLDMFGAEVSSNGANAFNAGIKGRYRELRIEDDHQLLNATTPVLKQIYGRLVEVQEPALNAVNARLLDDYIEDAGAGVKRWNKVLAEGGIDFQISLPHRAFRRAVGEFAGLHVDPQVNLTDQAAWQARAHEWLPSATDDAYLLSLMKPVYAKGEYANWIARPKAGIDRKPGDFEYVMMAALRTYMQ